MFGSKGQRSRHRPAGADSHHRRIEWPIAAFSALVAGLLALRAAVSIAVAVVGGFWAALPNLALVTVRLLPAVVAAVRNPTRQATVAALTVTAVGLVTAAGVAGIGAGVDSVATRHVAVTGPIDLNDRLLAAQRADRSARSATTPATPAPAKKKPAKPPAWVAPMAKFELSSCFGPRWGLMHQGIDFAMPAGTVIRAAGAGTVLAAGWSFAGYGISVVIDHGNGYLTHYAHASKVWVRPGQKVKPGQAIAREGSTGDSTGPHLHFEVHKGAMWHQIDPAKFLRARGVKIGC